PPMSDRTRTLLDGLFATEAMSEVFSDRARVQGMLDFEAALARAEADVGAIPPPAADAIASECRADLYDPDALGASAARAGNLAIPLVKALTARVASQGSNLARWVHWGATSQDAVDTGAVLQLRAALDWFDSELARLAETLAQLARAHERTLVLGRTW